jgi:hypothetical protein
MPSSVITPSTSSDSTPKASKVSSPFQSVQLQGGLSIPMGKYHPSNYKNEPKPEAANTSLHMPPPPSPSQTSPTRNHHRRPSDVKRKIQQYQRDMIAQARLAAAASTSSSGLSKKPDSPKLEPLGSPTEFMTPFELEQPLHAGYLAAKGIPDTSAAQQEMVGRMIRAEEERRRREGQSSPLARV